MLVYHPADINRIAIQRTLQFVPPDLLGFLNLNLVG
jgi:hypothetical protein